MRNSKILSFVAIFLIVLFSWGGQEGPKEKPKSLVFTNARLIDGTGAPAYANAVIVISEGQFKAVGKAGQVSVPEDAEIIDVAGKTVIPGLIDGHMHMTSFAPTRYDTSLSNDSIMSFRAVYRLNQLLLAGITTVRDCNSPSNVSIMAKKGFGEGLFVGSRPIVAGQGITSTGGHGSGNGFIADGEAEWRRGVREQLRRGADFVKLFPPYSRSEITGAIEEVHNHEKKVSVHSGMFEKQYDFIRWAIEAGADCVEHAYALPDDVIKMMAQKGTYCVPTVSVLLLIADNWSKKYPDRPPRKKHLESKEIFKKLRAGGVRMGVGTDPVEDNTLAYPGIYFDELEWFASNGYTPLETIKAATRTNAEICGVEEKLGTIEEGKIADLLVVDGDPLQDISILRTKIQIIVQEGKFIKR